MKEQLVKKLNKFGTLRIIKAGFVLTVLITGEGLSNMNNLNAIQRIIIDIAGKKYPMIEAIVNDENIFCMILRPA